MSYIFLNYPHHTANPGTLIWYLTAILSKPHRPLFWRRLVEPFHNKFQFVTTVWGKWQLRLVRKYRSGNPVIGSVPLCYYRARAEGKLEASLFTLQKVGHHSLKQYLPLRAHFLFTKATTEQTCAALLVQIGHMSEKVRTMTPLAFWHTNRIESNPVESSITCERL